MFNENRLAAGASSLRERRFSSMGRPSGANLSEKRLDRGMILVYIS